MSTKKVPSDDDDGKADSDLPLDFIADEAPTELELDRESIEWLLAFDPPLDPVFRSADYAGRGKLAAEIVRYVAETIRSNRTDRWLRLETVRRVLHADDRGEQARQSAVLGVLERHLPLQEDDPEDAPIWWCIGCHGWFEWTADGEVSCESCETTNTISRLALVEAREKKQRGDRKSLIMDLESIDPAFGTLTPRDVDDVLGSLGPLAREKKIAAKLAARCGAFGGRDEANLHESFRKCLRGK